MPAAAARWRGHRRTGWRGGPRRPTRGGGPRGGGGGRRAPASRQRVLRDEGLGRRLLASVPAVREPGALQGRGVDLDGLAVAGVGPHRVRGLPARVDVLVVAEEDLAV